MALCSTHSIHLSSSHTSAHRLHPRRRAISATSSYSSPLPLSVHGIRPALLIHHSHLRPICPHAAASSPGTASSPGSVHEAAPATYTSMKSDPLGFWDSHLGLQCDTAPHHDCNGLLSAKEDGALFLDAELRLLANAASDRAEMHSILAQQRDNWNKLFQRMLTSASMTACVLSGLNGQAHSLSLGLPAILLNVGTAAMMAIINQFQPSQLAEEQRTATRLFRKLASDIHLTLDVAPHLHQYTPLFLHNCKRRLQAIDKAFPMPLTPGGLEKFPAKVVPPVLIEPESIACMYRQNLLSRKIDGNNGWDEPLTNELQRVAALLEHSDIPKYTGWAQNLVKVNKCLAIAAPLFATLAALLNGIVITTASLANMMGMWAAVCSVLAAFANSFSNDMQLGMVFELYRNSAGYYLDVKTSIEETLRMPVEQRENGTLFRQRIAYQLGRLPADCTSIVSSCTAQNNSSSASSSTLIPVDAKEAGTLF